MKKGLILLFLLFIPVVCYANPDYTIDKYKIDIDINNNDYIVKENIEVSFHKIVTNMKMTLPYDIKDLKINTEYDTVTSDNRIITISNDKKANSSNNTVQCGICLICLCPDSNCGHIKNRCFRHAHKLL